MPSSDGDQSAATVVLPTQAAQGRLRPVDAHRVTIERGFWGDRLETNRTRSLLYGGRQLRRAGYLDNFRHAASDAGSYKASRDEAGMIMPFLDSDVYKWLEAVGWELGRAADPALKRQADQVIRLVGAAQRPDGYLNTYVQLTAGASEFEDLSLGHELYCVGHLVQAAVAWHRALSDDRLLVIARRAVNRIDGELGPGGRRGIDGHPGIEMALVELYRVTGESRYLELAVHQIDERGKGLLGSGRFGSSYWQDHIPVRRARTVTGHAVRQLYLDCGAVDAAVEAGDRQLLRAVARRWESMVASRTYLTGGLGSRHRGESFGSAFELPADRAYAETCAAVASVMLSWRLFLATGEAKYADMIERTLFNAVLPGVSLRGDRFTYVNPLHQRREAPDAGPQSARRAPWFGCACCPPNLMRLLSSLEHYIATVDDDGVQIHQYSAGHIQLGSGVDRLALEVATEYPWDGQITVTIDATPQSPWTLSMRIPAWCRAATLRINDEDHPVDRREGYVRLARKWEVNDRVELRLDMPPRITAPDPRIDAVRGCVAIERGPIVYCIEEVDLPDGVDLETTVLPANSRLELSEAPGLDESVRAIQVSLCPRMVTRSNWPYDDAAGASSQETLADSPMEVIAVPYFAWANRRPGAMRVWMPAATETRL